MNTRPRLSFQPFLTDSPTRSSIRLPWIPGEISDASINKGTALRRVCDHLNVTSDDAIAFGDSMNDAEILRAAGTGIAMGNAEEAVKKFADQVCERWDEDGIAKTLTRMGLI